VVSGDGDGEHPYELTVTGAHGVEGRASTQSEVGLAQPRLGDIWREDATEDLADLDKPLIVIEHPQ